MKYLLLFHCNLNYSLMPPSGRDLVCRSSYEMILDVLASYPEAHFSLEASGFTLDYLAEHQPGVLEKLLAAVRDGRCEPIGSPYAHMVLTAFPDRDGAMALAFGREAWERRGVLPETGWNPEFAWEARIPGLFAGAGYRRLVCDFDSYIQTVEGKRLPSLHTSTPEMIDELLPVNPAHPVLHRPVRLPEGMLGVTKTDRLAVRCIKYFQGAITLDEMLSVVDRFSAGEGYLAVFAGDAEYIGTTAWYGMRERGPLGNFSPVDGAEARLVGLIEALLRRGGLATVAEICDSVAPTPEPFTVEDGLAAHHNRASQWRQTPSARLLDARCDEVRRRLACAEALATSEEERGAVRKAWWHLVQGECADGRYPKPPLSPSPEDIGYCLEHLEEAESIARALFRGGGSASA